MSGTIQVYMVGITAAASLAATAGIRGAQVLLGPVNVLNQGIRMISVPEAARALRHSYRRLWLVGLAISFGVGAGENHPIGATWSYCNSGSACSAGSSRSSPARPGTPRCGSCFHAARPDPHRDAARGGDPLRRRRRSRRRRRRADRRPRRGACSARPARPAHHGPRRRRARLRADAHGRRRRRRTARGCSPRRASPPCRRSRPICPTRTRSATRGASAGSASTGTATALYRPRRQHHRPGGVPAHPPRGRARRRAAHQRRQRDHDFYEDLYREIFAELADVEHEAPARGSRRAGRGRPHAAPRRVRARVGAHGDPASTTARPAPAHQVLRPARRARAATRRGVRAGPRQRGPLPSRSRRTRARRGCRSRSTRSRPARSTSTSARAPPRRASTHDHR